MSTGGFATEIDFGTGEDVALRASSVMAVATYQRGPALGFQLGLGAVLDGTIGSHDGDVRPGVAVSVGLAWLARYESARAPFVLATAALAGSRARAVTDRGDTAVLTAADLRLGAMVGKTLGPITPYVVARGFAGPVGFRIGGDDVTGGDVHHYTVGAGAVVRLGRRLELAAEGLPVGEQSLALSAALAL